MKIGQGGKKRKKENRPRRLNTYIIGISEDENQRGRTEEILKTIFQENTPEIKNVIGN